MTTATTTTTDVTITRTELENAVARLGGRVSWPRGRRPRPDAAVIARAEKPAEYWDAVEVPRLPEPGRLSRRVFEDFFAAIAAGDTLTARGLMPRVFGNDAQIAAIDRLPLIASTQGDLL
ncbi:hypothetical protein [Stakelama tenebrarum]|uniref:Uncharacterized protein n=1 Tax=Stakelama tenebrarum TaxID=2711215 RepID=A0A6G6Y5K1_9SPHN|nr:hypothetical protein [Sphingosinithalassobacter tenebrarum]QIG80077.1 hypothetical protein G5C33_09995 [Sphingosinithalassobacter tenebrarum]